MIATIIDGRRIAREAQSSLSARTLAVLAARGLPPGLAVIIVGSDPASHVYVENKVRACHVLGLHSARYDFMADAPNSSILDTICNLNARSDMDGILVQLPLPAHLDRARLLGAIAPSKDVDGFHLANVGALAAGEAIFPPCTPQGVIKLLEAEGIAVAGQNVTIVGASNVVGKPMAMMLTARGATVTLCHALTRNLAEFTRLADIVIAAAGVPRLIGPEMIRRGAVVIDVGINRLPDGRITGDVDFEGVSRLASRITPVPGGVGPMTIAALMENTILAAERTIPANRGGQRRSA